MCGKAPLFRLVDLGLWAAMPLLQILLASVNSGVAARNNFSTCRKSEAFPHIDGQSPEAGS
jgi:hypothetical protein